jgi:ABC-type phosphate transport system substrate-binding protein
MRVIVTIAVSLAILPWIVLAQPAGSASTTFRVITNPKSSISTVDRAFLADAFLKKTTRWRDGELIRPVDLASDSPTRRKFTEDVLNRSVAAVRSYWQQLIFSGRDVPPPELDSEAAVVQYVQSHPGALGYISGATDAGSTKILGLK